MIVRNRAGNDPVRLLHSLSCSIGSVICDVDGSYYQNLRLACNLSISKNNRRIDGKMKLHTDGSFCSNPPEWIGIAMLKQVALIGADSVCLRLRDWPELQMFSSNRLSRKPVEWSLPGSAEVRCVAPIFNFPDCLPAIRFAHHCLSCKLVTSDIELAEYANAILNSVQQCKGSIRFSLMPGDLYFVDNRFAMHGRTAIKWQSGTYREIVRTRGLYS
ncbi:MAG: carbon starvation induced protein CsiD [Pirellulaceae bacterium]